MKTIKKCGSEKQFCNNDFIVFIIQINIKKLSNTIFYSNTNLKTNSLIANKFAVIKFSKNFIRKNFAAF